MGTDLPSWRITLTCDCAYRISGYPDLKRPMLCHVTAATDPDAPGVAQAHGLRMIKAAERIES